MRYILLTLTALLVAVSGAIHGMWTDRWGTAREQRLAVAAKLSDLPMTLGEWDATSLVMGDDVKKAARIDGYLMRNYINRRTGTQVSLLLVYGPAGPVSVHTPDVCYRGAGYDPVAAPQRRSLRDAVGGSTADFWIAKMRKENTEIPEYLQVLWAWSDGGAWRAPDRPRLTFARVPILFKLYVVRQMSGLEESGEDVSLQFISVLLPELRTSVLDAVQHAG
jgi:hypothetical protein